MEIIELEQAVLRSDNKAIQSIVSSKPELAITYIDFEGDSLLHFASLNGDKELASFLIGLGVDVNIKGANGETSIFRAVYRNNSEMVSFLIKLGAKVNIGNEQRETPIAIAESLGLDSSKQLYDILVNQFKVEADNYSRKMFHLGNNFLLEDKIDEALNAYDNAILYKYNFAEAYFNRGKAYLKTGNKQAACNDWQKATEYGIKAAYRLLWQYAPDEIDFDKSPAEAKQNLIEGIRRLINISSDEEGFKGLVKYILAQKGKQQTIKVFRSLEFGWQKNNMTHVDFCNVFCEVFDELRNESTI